MIFIGQNLFKVFHCLKTLSIDSSLHFDWAGLSFYDDPFNNFCSSTLLNLKITVGNFNDCYHLFDGRFDQLEDVHLTLGALSARHFGPEPKLKPKQVC